MVKTDQELPYEVKMKTDEEISEEPLDPKQVGQEFVRTYYSFVNEGPEHLFRFFTNQSSFVHGGIEKPGQEDPVVRGQQAINDKIKSLNFVNSQVKVFQTDSQLSHANTVLVQTAGEINRDGVTRRFMQTFVLARKSKKLFYVHNCIFRYQDEDFSSEKEQSSEEQEAVQEGTESDVSEEAVDMPLAMEPPADLATSPVAIVGDSLESSESQSSPTTERNEVVLDEEEPTAVTKEEEEEEVQASSPVMEEEEKEAETESPKPSGNTNEEPSEIPSAPQAESTKTFSWAALVSKNTPTNASSSEPLPVAQPPPKPVVKEERKPVVKEERKPVVKEERKPVVKEEHKPVVKEERKPEAAAANGDAAAKPAEPPKAQRTPKENQFARERRNSSKGEERNGENGNGRRNYTFGVKYPDEQQLFVGNLPHSLSESELKTFFGGFGTVLELRINTKSGGGKVPNFGFVVFDCMETAQNVLKQKPILYNGEHRLNVEEKKTRGDQRPYGGRGRYGPGPRNYGSRGGPRGGGDSRPYNGERQNGGREFQKRGASNGASRQ